MTLLTTLPSVASTKIETENIDVDKSYEVIGQELIDIAEHINNLEDRIGQLEDTNDLLKERLEVERLASDGVIKSAGEVIDKQQEQIEALEEYNKSLNRRRYVDCLLYFGAGLGVGQLL